MNLGALTKELDGRNLKGEIVLVVDRAPARIARDEMLDAALDQALETMTVKDAATQVAQDLGLPRRDVSQAALGKGKNG